MTTKLERDTSRSRTLNTLARGRAGVKTGYISYTKGYKYQLTQSYEVYVPIYRPLEIETQFISLDRFVFLCITQIVGPGKNARGSRWLCHDR